MLAWFLVYEAIDRIVAGPKNVGFLMFMIDAFGLVVNIIVAFLLAHHLNKHSDTDNLET